MSRTSFQYSKKKNTNPPFPIDGLVALYNMFGDTLDSYGTQNGVNQGAEAAPGLLGTSLLYNVDEVVVSNFSGITNKASVNFWLACNNHIPTQGGSSGLIDLNTADLMSHYPFTNDIIYLSVLTNTRKQIGAGIVTDRTQWHMVTITADEVTNEWKFYQNAQLVYTGTVGSINIKSTIQFGKSQGNAWLSGRMQVVPLYNKALSQSEINDLYNGGNGLILE